MEIFDHFSRSTFVKSSTDVGQDRLAHRQALIYPKGVV